MSLTLEAVKNIADLARLDLTQEEMESYRAQLSKILAYFDVLNNLDTSEVPPDFNVSRLNVSLRADEINPSFIIEDLMRNAPQVEEDQFRVPPIFE